MQNKQIIEGRKQKIQKKGRLEQQELKKLIWPCYAHLWVDTVEPGYNDIGLCDTSSITSDILWYQLIPRC